MANILKDKEYLSTKELSERIPYSLKTLRNFLCEGVLLEGIHFTRPAGRPVWKWSSIKKWIDSGGKKPFKRTK